MKNKGVAYGVLLGLIVSIVIGLAATFPIILDTTNKATTIYSTPNNTLNASNISTLVLSGFTADTDEPFTVLANTLLIYNNTDCATDVMTQGTHFDLTGNGTTTPDVNLTGAGVDLQPAWVCAVYSYQSTAYTSNSSARAILRLLPLMMAIVFVWVLAAFAM